MFIGKDKTSRTAFIMTAAELTDHYAFTIRETAENYAINFEGNSASRNEVMELIEKYMTIEKIDVMTRATNNALYLSVFGIGSRCDQ